MENVILQTIQTLGVILLALVPIGLTTIQYAKEKVGLSDKRAELFSLVIGFVLSALVAWVYAADLGYQLVLGQWVGVALFVVLGTLGPSGGYKVIGSFSGSRS